MQLRLGNQTLVHARLKIASAAALISFPSPQRRHSKHSLLSEPPPAPDGRKSRSPLSSFCSALRASRNPHALTFVVRSIDA